jgi:hypothetical protein
MTHRLNQHIDIFQQTHDTFGAKMTFVEIHGQAAGSWIDLDIAYALVGLQIGLDALQGQCIAVLRIHLDTQPARRQAGYMCAMPWFWLGLVHGLTPAFIGFEFTSLTEKEG